MKPPPLQTDVAAIRDVDFAPVVDVGGECLGAGFLERPKPDEMQWAIVWWKRVELGVLLAREYVGDNSNLGGVVDLFDVQSDVDIATDCDGYTVAGVRDAETQVQRNSGCRGPPAGIVAETPSRRVVLPSTGLR